MYSVELFKLLKYLKYSWNEYTKDYDEGTFKQIHNLWKIANLGCGPCHQYEA